MGVSQSHRVHSLVSVAVYSERDISYMVMCLWPLGFRPNSGTGCERQCRLGRVWQSAEGGGSALKAEIDL